MIQDRSVELYLCIQQTMLKFSFHRASRHSEKTICFNAFMVVLLFSFKYFYNTFITLSRNENVNRDTHYLRNFDKKEKKKKTVDPRALDPSRKLIRREEGATRLISVAQGTSVNTLSSTYPSRETKKRRRGEKERQSACVPPGTNSSRRIFACDTMPECGTARSSTPIPFPFLSFNPFPPRGVYLSAAAETGRGILLK